MKVVEAVVVVVVVRLANAQRLLGTVMGHASPNHNSKS